MFHYDVIGLSLSFKTRMASLKGIVLDPDSCVVSALTTNVVSMDVQVQFCREGWREGGWREGGWREGGVKWHMGVSSTGGVSQSLFSWQITKTSDKSADNQSEARISVAYNIHCHFVADDKFCETPPGLCADIRPQSRCENLGKGNVN